MREVERVESFTGTIPRNNTVDVVLQVLDRTLHAGAGVCVGV